MPPRKQIEPYDYKDDEKGKRVTKVYRPPGSTGKPSQAWMKGLETGFPTKAEFNRLFPKSQRLICEHKDFKGYEFAWASEAPRELRAWVADQVRIAKAVMDPDLGGSHVRGVWCKLPKGPRGQDAVPQYGTLLDLRKQSRDPADAASSSGGSDVEMSYLSDSTLIDLLVVCLDDPPLMAFMWEEMVVERGWDKKPKGSRELKAVGELNAAMTRKGMVKDRPERKAKKR